jgi:hypothetical protein
VDGLAVMGLEAKSSTPAELAAMLKADTERWGPIVKSIGFGRELSWQAPAGGACCRPVRPFWAVRACNGRRR